MNKYGTRFRELWNNAGLGEKEVCALDIEVTTAVYPLVPEILDENGGAQPASLVAQVLLEADESLLSSKMLYNSEMTKRLVCVTNKIGKEYGVSLAALSDACEEIHGPFDMLKGHKSGHEPFMSDFTIFTVNLLYRSKEALREYVNSHTKKENLVVIRA